MLGDRDHRHFKGVLDTVMDHAYGKAPQSIDLTSEGKQLLPGVVILPPQEPDSNATATLHQSPETRLSSPITVALPALIASTEGQAPSPPSSHEGGTPDSPPGTV